MGAWLVMMFVMALALLVPLVLAVGVILWAVLRGGAGGGGALAILRERYARGELTPEQFQEMRRDLER